MADSEPCLHMVDGNSNFCDENVDHIIKRSAKLSAASAVVSIVGAQSSGKSFLMNRLFQTKFPEMDGRRGWSQTTRGIMMSRCKEDSFLLLDVEGFDGRERAQDTSFENQAALFALAVSDLMIVNMHIADIGRNQAGGTQLFRTIFQERTKIEGVGLTKILVVLRYYNGETSHDILRRVVLGSLQQAWKSVNTESMKFESYIEVDVFGMPDKEMSQKFQKEVTALRTLISKTRSAKFPASMESWRLLWDDIKKNKKLDIPTHQVLISSLNCRRLVEVAFKFLDSPEVCTFLKSEESPCGFKKISDELFQSTTTWYDQETKMYDPDIRDKERQYVVQKLYKIFTDYAREIIWKMMESTSKQFKGEFDRNVQNIEQVDLYGEMIVNACTEKFMSSCEDLKVFDSGHLQRIRGELGQKMRSYTALHIVAINEERARRADKRTLKRVIQVGVIAIKLLALATGNNFF